jgi:hypothetical protein
MNYKKSHWFSLLGSNRFESRAQFQFRLNSGLILCYGVAPGPKWKLQVSKNSSIFHEEILPKARIGANLVRFRMDARAHDRVLTAIFRPLKSLFA